MLPLLKNLQETRVSYFYENREKELSCHEYARKSLENAGERQWF